MPDDFCADIWQTLIPWYRLHGRDLPWRHTNDPYAILVSEIMLQQTQVERAVIKYQEFLETFPTLQSLAEAAPADVIRAWATLGYNSRAIRLQSIAKIILTEYHGVFPAEPEQLLKLPGIGPYTAGAVTCFAFKKSAAAVDTNIRRTLWRIFKCEVFKPANTPKEEYAFAQSVVPPNGEDAYLWNQALMDLGATVCLPVTPKCDICPLLGACRAAVHARGYSLFPEDAVVAPILRAEIAEASAKYTTGSQKRPREPFHQSRRYFRGRIIHALRARESAILLTELGPMIKPDWEGRHLSWLEDLVSGLVRDKLAIWADDAHTAAALDGVSKNSNLD